MAWDFVRFTDAGLARVGVEILDPARIWLRCKTCGATWSPKPGKRGRLPNGWWKCPKDPTHTTLPKPEQKP